VQEFLLLSATLREMTPAACDAIQGKGGSAAMLAYLAPGVALTWLVYLLLLQVNRDRPLIRWLGIPLLAFLSAGFSETGAAFQAAGLLIVFAGLLLFPGADPRREPRRLWAFGLAFLMTLLAVLLLAVSPSNAERIAMYPHPGPIRLLALTVTYGLTFIFESLKSYPLPSLVTLAFSAVIAMQVGANGLAGRLDNRKIFLSGMLVIIACFVLVCATAAPSALARSAYPEQRAWMPARAAMVFALAGIGFLAGRLLLQVKGARSRPGEFLFMAVILLTGMYAIRAVPRIMDIIQPFRGWSVRWDARDEQIRAAAAAGARDIRVTQLPMLIPYVSELSSDPLNWYNQCAAGWYAVDSISAVGDP